ncbi:MAG: hypothetical protein IT431_11775 [Phycisphaerales bacterium]|nr:hypothetical protein [Phycisphaerales bacterium]
MSREIASGRGPGARGDAPADQYRDRLLKYIPGEVIVVWGTISAIITQAKPPAAQEQLILWVVFAVLLVATPLYQWRLLKIRLPVQLAVATIAFAVWVFYLGGPFASVGWYKPLYGAVVLPLFTFLVPLLEP